MKWFLTLFGSMIPNLKVGVNETYPPAAISCVHLLCKTRKDSDPSAAQQFVMFRNNLPGTLCSLTVKETTTQKQQDKDSQLFVQMQHILSYHESMLSDRVRNAAFHKALKKHVHAGSAVLDIGTGTGIWAIAAAKLGAKRVVAVEREKILIPIIEKLLKNNGVADRVEVLTGDSRQLNIKGKFDLVISETIGNEAFDEEIVPIMIDARTRFLKRGGALIPKRVTSIVAPAHVENYGATLPAGLKLQYQYLELLNFDIPRRIRDLSRLKFLAPARALTSVDLVSAKTPPDLSNLSVSWRLKDASRLNCLVLWADVVVTDGVKLTTIKSPNWSAISFPLEPFSAGPARIDCQFALTNKQYFWTVKLTAPGRGEMQSHSPVFPYASLKTRM